MDSVFALEKHAFMGNGRIVGRRTGGINHLVVSFLTNDEASRFLSSFSQDPTGADFTESDPAPEYEASCVPVGKLRRHDINVVLEERMAKGPEVQPMLTQVLIERVRKFPDEDFAFKLHG